MARFEKIEKYKDSNLPLPVRKTAGSAGYDFTVTEDVVIPSYLKLAKCFAVEKMVFILWKKWQN